MVAGSGMRPAGGLTTDMVFINQGASRPQASNSQSAHHLSSAGFRFFSTSQVTVRRASRNSWPVVTCFNSSFSTEPSENSTVASCQRNRAAHFPASRPRGGTTSICQFPPAGRNRAATRCPFPFAAPTSRSHARRCCGGCRQWRSGRQTRAGCIRCCWSRGETKPARDSWCHGFNATLR